MIGFTAEPVLEPSADGTEWTLQAPLTYSGSVTITVPAGFVTDFASIPQIFTNVLPRYSDYGRAAVIHDYLYKTKPFSRSQSDAILLEAMTAIGVQIWKRQVIYWTVRLFGWYAWSKD